MNTITANKIKIILKFSEDELLLLCNSLNEVCHGIKIAEFDTCIGAPKDDVKILLNSLGAGFDKIKQLKLD